jgi:hypothetical protein
MHRREDAPSRRRLSITAWRGRFIVFQYRNSYELLRKTVVETFQNRKTDLTFDTAEFGCGFSEDSVHLTRWNAFLKKKKALVNVSMTDAIERIRVFVSPLITGSGKSEWNPEKGDWE